MIFESYLCTIIESYLCPILFLIVIPDNHFVFLISIDYNYYIGFVHHFNKVDRIRQSLTLFLNLSIRPIVLDYLKT